MPEPDGIKIEVLVLKEIGPFGPGVSRQRAMRLCAIRLLDTIVVRCCITDFPSLALLH